MPRAQPDSFPQVHAPPPPPEPYGLRLRQNWIHLLRPILVLLLPTEAPVPRERFHPENRQPTLNAGIVGFQQKILVS